MATRAGSDVANELIDVVPSAPSGHFVTLVGIDAGFDNEGTSPLDHPNLGGFTAGLCSGLIDSEERAIVVDRRASWRP